MNKMRLMRVTLLVVLATIASVWFACGSMQQAADRPGVARSAILGGCNNGGGGFGGSGASSSSASSSSGGGAGGGVADAGGSADVIYVEETWANYTQGNVRNQVRSGFGWDLRPKVMGTTCTLSMLTADGHCDVWCEGAQGGYDKIVPNVFAVAGYPASVNCFEGVGASLDTRSLRTMGRRFTSGTAFYAVPIRLATPPPASGWCQVHLYDGVPNLNATYDCKQGETFEWYDNAQMATVQGGYTAHGGPGAATFSVLVNGSPLPVDGSTAMTVVEVSYFNTDQPCTNASPACPVCTPGVPCNNTVSMWVNPAPGSSAPPAQVASVIVRGFATDTIALGAAPSNGIVERCDFGTFRVTSSYAAVWKPSAP